MPKYPFLDFQLPLYQQHLEAWKRDERRLFGGDAVLVDAEFPRWKGETDDTFFAARKAQARYLNFPKLHASTLVGHISQQTPTPNYGRLGDARSRDKIDTPTFAEMLEYNIDGIGQDGTELRVWFDAVQERAIATGYRFIMCEMPDADVLRGIRGTARDVEVAGTSVAARERQAGFRPFAVEYSPISAPYFLLRHGRFDAIVFRFPMDQESPLDADGNLRPSGELGYYLLVRQGFGGFGGDFSQGGWWKFDPGQNLMSQGTWADTRGQIPVALMIGEGSTGTTERPAIARSLTMELGQIAVGLMNLTSARDYNAVQAAKSVNWILGITSQVHSEALAQLEDGSIAVGIPPIMAPDGSTVVVPQIWNSSASLIDSQAFDLIIRGGIDEAREIMVRQVTSTPDSSGRSKEAGFAEATSPLLARLAASRQQAMNTFLYFASLRFGIAEPNANVVIPRDFDLTPVVDDIDGQLDAMRRAGVRSPTLEVGLIMRRGDEKGLIPDEDRDTIESEMTESIADREREEARERSLLEEVDAEAA